MGLFKRIKDIAKANINDILDNCENPSKMVDQYLREMTEGLAEARKEMANVIAEETRLKRLMNDNDIEINNFDSLARRALTDGIEDDARTFIEKKQILIDKQNNLQIAYDTAHTNAQKLRDTYDKLMESIEILQQKRNTIKAKIAVAKVQQKANKLMGTNMVIDAISDFKRMDVQADTMLDQANAMEELNQQSIDKAYALAKKYDSVNKSTIDNEITRLKSEIYSS